MSFPLLQHVAFLSQLYVFLLSLISLLGPLLLDLSELSLQKLELMLVSFVAFPLCQHLGPQLSCLQLLLVQFSSCLIQLNLEVGSYSFSGLFPEFLEGMLFPEGFSFQSLITFRMQSLNY